MVRHLLTVKEFQFLNLFAGEEQRDVLDDYARPIDVDILLQVWQHPQPFTNLH